MIEPDDFDEMNEGFRAGFVAIAGRPNVGKSSLLNALLGQKIAAVTFRPQTTRRQQLGILTLDYAQIIFMDTPGYHEAHHKLGEYMNEEAVASFEEADALLIVVDATAPPNVEDKLLAELVNSVEALPKVLAVNKMDAVPPEAQVERVKMYQDLFNGLLPTPISALQSSNLDGLLKELVDALPENPPFYPPDQVTDAYEREIAADLIRSAALEKLKYEVPHGIAVRIDEYTERGNTGAFIAATLFVERDSQKGIVIGKSGTMLKQIGTAARKEIEEMSGRKAFLRLRVKVRKNWRNNENMLARFGFKSRK